MKKITTIIIILLGMALLCKDVQNQVKSNKQTGVTLQSTDASTSLYISNAITVKLKEGVGDFTKKEGYVALGIQSLDEKINRFEVYEMDKRFRYNPSKLKSGMPDLSRIYKITFPDRFSVEQVVSSFSSDPNVEYAEPIPIHFVNDVPDDELLDQCQHLPQIMATEAWEIHKGEDGAEEIIIAIVDTGVDWDHEDLQSNIWQNMAEDADGDGKTMEYISGEWVLDPDDINGLDDDDNGFVDDLIGWNFILNSSDPNPIIGNPAGDHGTHCGGISNGATNNGIGIASISWNVSLMGICTDENNTLEYGYDGIIYAAENGADMISNSWSGASPSQANQEVIDYATQLGSIVLAAAGNHNSTQFRYPASYEGVISVASVSGDDTKAAYSGYGLAVDISAPGGGTEGGIISTVPYDYYSLKSGTSMATPLVAGCFGLLKSLHPDWTNEELITQLLGSADDINTLNTNYENLLGTGRVNALSFLTEENVTMPMVLKIDHLSTSYVDDNGNLINEPGESAYLNLEFRNYVPGITAEDVTVTLTSDDDEITIIDGTASVTIPPDGIFSIENLFQFQVSEDATSHFAVFTVTFDSEYEIPGDGQYSTEVLIAPSGTFVFEGDANADDYSGTYIKGILDQLEIHNTYSNTYPPTLMGFDHAFVSHGNFGQSLGQGTMITEEQSLMFQEYLENGGNLFVDMGTMIGAADYYGFSNASTLKSLFGIQSNAPNMDSNPIDSLYGMEGSIMEGIYFTHSDQAFTWYLDDLTLKIGATATFSESNYGIVSCMNDGESTYGHKTFYLCYSLGELIDKSPVNSKNNLLLQVLDFFEMLPEGYILAGFNSDKGAGGPPLEVQFTNVSISADGYPITAWAWDFNEDGITDSDEENPAWTFEAPGNHTVTLITTNELMSDTLIKENCITVNDGFLVYEGKAGGEGYSGTFILDHMEANGYWLVNYTNLFPEDLRGYWAVFLSFGNYDSENTVLTENMADIIIDYLKDGGFVYLEGGDAFGFDQLENSTLLDVFGLWGADDGGYNSIDLLEGQDGALTEGQEFLSSSQQALTYIDLYSPAVEAIIAFEESDYGPVAVQNTGEFGQRTFCFSYTLADLDDGESPNTRGELLDRICGFFDIYTRVDLVQGSRFKVEGYPNPTASIYKIYITLDQPERVSIQLFDIMGKVVGDEIEKSIGSEGTLELDLGDMDEGIYFCKVEIGNEIITKKIIKIN